MSQSNISDSMIKELLEDLGVDAIYITDSNGVVKYTNENQLLDLIYTRLIQPSVISETKNRVFSYPN